jgi:putative DNA methylase
VINSGALTAESESVATALEDRFPIVEVSQVAEQESWRKEINRPLYHIHKWWATRLGSVFRAITLAALSPKGTSVWEGFYERHHFAGKVVLDPFMGSGTTLGEALKLGAKAIGCDINPVSTFLVRQALTRVPTSDLRDAFGCLERSIAPQIRRYYQTTDPLTGTEIPVLYFFWVKLVTTPKGEIIPLFDRYVFAQDAYPKKKPRAQIVCPECWAIIEGRYDATSIECHSCKTVFDPQKGCANGQWVTGKTGRYRIKDLLPLDGGQMTHRLYALMALRPTGEKTYLKAEPHDLHLYKEAESRLARENLPLPSLPVRPGHNTDQARGYNYLQWRDFFNARQLLCLGLLLREILCISDRAVQEQMLCLFSSTLEFNNLFCSFKGEGTGAVRHMFSNHILKPERTPLENSVWGTDKSSGTFCSLFESRLIRAKLYLDNPFEVSVGKSLFDEPQEPRKVVCSDPIDVPCAESWNEFMGSPKGLLVLNGDSARLPLPSDSVDAVVTDPPYFDFVHYSELSDFFFAWLSPVLKDRYPAFDNKDSSDSGEVQHKDPRTFARQLALVLKECHRVLKRDGVLSFSFHHSREEGWAAIHEAVVGAGFQIVAAHPVHAEMRGSSPKSASKSPISLDAIMVCRKVGTTGRNYLDLESVIGDALRLISLLSSSGMDISDADSFVVVASQALISASAEMLPYEQMVQRLKNLRQMIKSELICSPVSDVECPAIEIKDGLSPAC